MSDPRRVSSGQKCGPTSSLVDSSCDSTSFLADPGVRMSFVRLMQAKWSRLGAHVLAGKEDSSMQCDSVHSVLRILSPCLPIMTSPDLEQIALDVEGDLPCTSVLTLAKVLFSGSRSYRRSPSSKSLRVRIRCPRTVLDAHQITEARWADVETAILKISSTVVLPSAHCERHACG